MSDIPTTPRKRLPRKVRFTGDPTAAPAAPERVRLDTERPDGAAATTLAGDSMILPLDLIDPDPSNVRTGPPDLVADARLRASILENGVLEPPTVRDHPDTPGRYMVVMGHRRVRAARDAGLLEIRCTLLSHGVNDSWLTAVQAAENMVRAPMHPVDGWAAVRRMVEQGMSPRAAYASIGIGSRDGALLDRLSHMHQGFIDTLRLLPAAAMTDQRRILHILSNADMVDQERAWQRVAKTAPTSPAQALQQAANALDKPTITGDMAIFPLVLDGGPIPWIEDLFMPGDDPRRFSTKDVRGFLREQRAALKLRVEAEVAAGHPCILVDYDDKSQDPALPAGWTRSYLDAAKPLPKGSKSTVATYVRTSGYSIGQVVRMRLEPKEAKAGKDATEKPARGPITHKGQAIIADAQEIAIQRAVDETESIETLLASLLIILGGGTVRTDGGPHNIEPRWNGYDSNRFTDISARVAECGPHATGVDFRETLRQCAREAIKRVTACPAPKRFSSSGDRALWLGNFLDAARLLPRFDTMEFLAECNGATLTALCGTYGQNSGKMGAMRSALAGRMEHWLPDASGFPGPSQERVASILAQHADGDEAPEAEPDEPPDAQPAAEEPEADNVFGDPEPTAIGGDDYVGVPGA